MHKELDPAAYVYLSLANDPGVMMIMRDLQAQMDAEGIEWQPAPTLHITMAYAPEAERSQLLMIAQALHLYEPLRIASEGLGIFENGDERALHIKVRRHDLLEKAQQEVAASFAFHGIPLSKYSDPEAWQPHITLAYLPPSVEVPVIDSSLMTYADKLIVGRGDFEPFAEITAVEIKGKSTIASSDPNGLRLMLIVSSNAYKDREEEIVSQGALEQYVAESWDHDMKTFTGDNPYLLWHGGDPIGEIIYADMEGPFLIEVARERPNAVVNLAREGEEPILAEVKTVWDMLEAEPDLAASQQFAYITGDREDGVYEYIKKMETSALPRWAAANYFTEAQVIRS